MQYEARNYIANFLSVCVNRECPCTEVCRFATCEARPSSFCKLKRGECLPESRSACAHLRIVRSGLVATCAVTSDGRRQILSLNTPGDAVCTISARGAECCCEALTESEVCELDLAGEAERLHRDPAYAMLLFRIVHDRLERSSAHLVTLGRLDSMERICGFLAELTRKTGRFRAEGWHVALPMSREDIADYLGLNTNTVSRLLSRVRKAELVKFHSLSEYEVPDLARLEARVPFSFARGVRHVSEKDQELAS